MSALYRSRSMMKAFDQIISSAGQSRAGTSSTVSSTACSNHASSTRAKPLPELKMRSITYSPTKALPSQCGNVNSVWESAAASASSDALMSAGRTKTSMSLVSRKMPV